MVWRILILLTLTAVLVSGCGADQLIKRHSGPSAAQVAQAQRAAKVQRLRNQGYVLYRDIIRNEQDAQANPDVACFTELPYIKRDFMALGRVVEKLDKLGVDVTVIAQDMIDLAREVGTMEADCKGGGG